jgi:hypothetical protein
MDAVDEINDIKNAQDICFALYPLIEINKTKLNNIQTEATNDFETKLIENYVKVVDTIYANIKSNYSAIKSIKENSQFLVEKKGSVKNDVLDSSVTSYSNTTTPFSTTTPFPFTTAQPKTTAYQSTTPFLTTYQSTTPFYNTTDYPTTTAYQSTTPYFSTIAQPSTTRDNNKTTIISLPASVPIINTINSVFDTDLNQTSASFTTSPNAILNNIITSITSAPSEATYASTTPNISKNTVDDKRQYTPATAYNYTTLYNNVSYKNECDKYISGLIENVTSGEMELLLDRKYLDCFTEPGNCFTLSNGKTVCISGKTATLLIEEQSKSGFNNYNENFLEAIGDKLRVSIQIIDKKLPINQNTTNRSSVQTTLSDSDFATLSKQIEKKTLNDVAYSAQQQSSNNARGRVDNNGSSDKPAQGSREILRNNNNNIFQSGGMSVQPERRHNYESDGKLQSFSSNNAKVVFPDAPNVPDNYSYNGALQSKGSDYVPMNSISETNKMLGRLDYTMPPPANMDFTYFGALRSKGGEDAKPVNALQGLNNYSEKILDENLYSMSGKIGMQEFPIPNRTDYTMSRPEVNKNNPINNGSQPIDLYSQYGALVPKDNFYA